MVLGQIKGELQVFTLFYTFLHFFALFDENPRGISQKGPFSPINIKNIKLYYIYIKLYIILYINNYILY